MKTDMRWSLDPVSARKLDTAGLRENFLVENLFESGEIHLTYSHDDRLVIGGAAPAATPLKLEPMKTFGTDRFFARREAVFANIGEAGEVVVDGVAHKLGHRDMLYVGKGAEQVSFSGSAAKFYIVSAPAHTVHPTTLIRIGEANRVNLGAPETSNERSIYQFVHAKGVQSCQLVVGMTILAPGSIWNTMPAHLHDRRSEAYLYFGMAAKTRVFHFMGEPNETRHIVIASEQAVLSPGWSIHSGAGTANYTFIWAMAGDNVDYTDVDPVAVEDLR
jgi:4-deoxy-L-threo-5-hexosulose-uronate ketol-isomerase